MSRITGAYLGPTIPDEDPRVYIRGLLVPDADVDAGRPEFLVRNIVHVNRPPAKRLLHAGFVSDYATAERFVRERGVVAIGAKTAAEAANDYGRYYLEVVRGEMDRTMWAHRPATPDVDAGTKVVAYAAPSPDDASDTWLWALVLRDPRPVRVGAGVKGAHLPSVEPPGARVAFIGSDGSKSCPGEELGQCLFVATPGKKALRVAGVVGRLERPRWDHDGTLLVMVHDGAETCLVRAKPKKRPAVKKLFCAKSKHPGGSRVRVGRKLGGAALALG